MAQITGNGFPLNTSGDLPAVGSTAPAFELIGADLSIVTLDDFAGKRKVIATAPSLDTEYCATMTRSFHERAAGLHDTVVLVVSADLPFAQKRFCDSAGVENVVTLSMMRDRKFAEDYGVLIVDGAIAGLCARAVLVLDTEDTVIHTQLVPEISTEPDYDTALAVLA